MYKNRKITPAYEQDILARAAEGMNLAQIAAWLLEHRGLAISQMTLSRRLRQTKEARHEAAVAVTREHLAPIITSDLDVLGRELRRCSNLTTRLYRIAVGGSPGTVRQDALEMYAKALVQLRALVDTRLKFSGAEPDKETDRAMPKAPVAKLAVLRALVEREEHRQGVQ